MEEKVRPLSVGGEDDRRAKEQSATTKWSKHYEVPTNIQDPRLTALSDSVHPWGPNIQGPRPSTCCCWGSRSESGRMAWVAIVERVGSTRLQEKTDTEKKEGKQGAGRLTQVNNWPPTHQTPSWRVEINHEIEKHWTCGRGMHVIQG